MDDEERMELLERIRRLQRTGVSSKGRPGPL
jgi:hypothetical protein